MKHPTHFLIEK